VGVFRGRSLFVFLFTRSRREEYVVRSILRQHARGGLLAEVLDDA
jgi:hypothetical protein